MGVDFDGCIMPKIDCTFRCGASLTRKESKGTRSLVDGEGNFPYLRRFGHGMCLLSRDAVKAGSV